jgi:hypothetical protein
MLSSTKTQRKVELVRATLSAIQRQGYYLSHAAIGGLPLDTACDRLPEEEALT